MSGRSVAPRAATSLAVANGDRSERSESDKARRPDGDIPVVFALPHGKGRVFNSGFRHLDETWDNPRVQQMHLGVVRWAMGMTAAPLPLDANRPQLSPY